MFGPRQWRIGFGEDSELEYPSEVVELHDEVPPDEGPRPWESTEPERESEEQGRLFYKGGVQMRFADWKATYVSNLRGLSRSMREVYGSVSKIARSFARQARDFEECGKWVERVDCGGCGAGAHRLIVTCHNRLCPGCGRSRSTGKQRALKASVEELRKWPSHQFQDGTWERPGLFMATFTARFDPKSPASHTPLAYRRRLNALKRALRRSFREVLRYDKFGARIADAGIHWEVEVSYGGMLHIHGLYWGLHLAKADLMRVHDIVNEELGEGNGGWDFEPMDADDEKSYKEAAKYVAKSSGPRRTLYRGTSTWMDPALAACVTWALFRQQCSGGLGSLRKLAKEAERLEDCSGQHQEHACRKCGTVGEWGHRKVIRAEFVKFTDIIGVCCGDPLPVGLGARLRKKIRKRKRGMMG